MTSDDPLFKAFSDFGIDDLPAEAAVSRRMLRRLEDIDQFDNPWPGYRGCARRLGVQRRRTCRGRTRESIHRIEEATGTSEVNNLSLTKMAPTGGVILSTSPLACVG
jgi:hypothetical protein